MKLLGIIFLLLSVSACSYLDSKPSNHKAMCAQLKNSILMNGATMNSAIADKHGTTGQTNNLVQLNQSYEKEGC